MARYGRDYGVGYPESGGMGPYDRFRFDPRRGEARGGRPAMGDREMYPEGPGWGGPRQGRYGGDGQGFRRGGYIAGRGPDASTMRGHHWQTGQPFGEGYSDADRVRAGDLMTPNPEAVMPDTPLAEVARKMRDLDVGIIPVVDSEDDFRLRGVITDRDIAVRAAAEGKDMTKEKVSGYMTEKVECVHENDHVRDVFTVMKRVRVRRVPVVDDDQKLLGIIAQADLAVNYAGLDLQRETEVEEVLERISEPARPNWGRQAHSAPSRRRPLVGRQEYDDWLRDEVAPRLRAGWDRLREEARHLMGRRYDRDWR